MGRRWGSLPPQPPRTRCPAGGASVPATQRAVSSGSRARNQQQSPATAKTRSPPSSAALRVLPAPPPRRAALFSASKNYSKWDVQGCSHPARAPCLLSRQGSRSQWLETPFLSGKRQFCMCERGGGGMHEQNGTEQQKAIKKNPQQQEEKKAQSPAGSSSPAFLLHAC